jgi:RNA polymerase sigma-70 factor (ECF subfamily)
MQFCLTNTNNMKNFNQIYAENYTKILNYVTWKLNNYHDAEDVTSIAFTKVSQKLSTFDSEKGCFNTWLYTVVNNCILDHLRSEAQRKANTLHVSNFVDSETGNEFIQIVDNNSRIGDAEMENRELHQKLAKSFRSLKPRYKSIAYLYFLKERPYNEIAELCNVPMGTVKGMISRVREMLQTELQKQQVYV